MKRKVGIILFITAFIFLLPYYLIFNGLPPSFSLTQGNESIVDIPLPFNLYVEENDDELITINGREVNKDFMKLNPGPLKLKAKNVGSSSLKFKLFGLIPIKSIRVNILPEVKVYPGGQAIGVLLRSKGVMIVGNSFVEGRDGKRYYPAAESGLKTGDKILKINNQEINDKIKLASRIQELMKENDSVDLLIQKKNGDLEEAKIKPVMNKQGLYMIGLYVDDGVAGVGTLTFSNPDSKEYGALGHEIIESNSQTRIEVREGKIIEARISGIHSGQRGLPGEKLGTFFQTENVIGNITRNNIFGIYGDLEKVPKNPYFKRPIPVAAHNEVERGPAKIYTVVNEGEIEEFSVNIDRVYHQSYPGEKGMIISITDPELKNATGGIIQGMSGSPIVQNNKLVGAVTHVFVNEPSKGYGIFAEWMLIQTDSVIRTNEN
ncbi:MAG: SpoIVB peptidase [Halanaerobiaceae bacterium]